MHSTPKFNGPIVGHLERISGDGRLFVRGAPLSSHNGDAQMAPRSSELRYLAFAAAAAMRARAQIERRGVTVNGYPTWKKWECAICQALYPDYRELQQRLPHRSYGAIVLKCMYLGLSTKRHHWIYEESNAFRRMYPRASVQDLKKAFPFATRADLCQRAFRLRLFRPRKPYKPTGFPEIDQIRDGCFHARLTMRDLDYFINRKYFSRGGWRRGTVDQIAVRRAFKLLRQIGEPSRDS